MYETIFFTSFGASLAEFHISATYQEHKFRLHKIITNFGKHPLSIAVS